MTKDQIIAELKAQYPSLSFGINDETFDMGSNEYEETIATWADNVIHKEQAKAEAQATRITKIEAYKKLGLSEAEINALLPIPNLRIRDEA